jgi:hypothetical protein
MTARMDSIIQQAYRVTDVLEPNHLLLQEDSNAGKRNALCTVKLNIKDIADYAVYKFDQKVTAGRNVCESYAPFLQPGKPCAMCDFIVFFRTTVAPDRLCAWVVNLKSTADGNNIQQMRAGHRLCEFLLGKLDDALKIQDKPESLLRGHIDFVFFSLPQTKTTRKKSGTNALSEKEHPANDPHGKTPDKPIRVTCGAYKLGALARE